MKRAESPYDRMVDMPTKTSEKLIKIGDLVTLCESVSLHRIVRIRTSYRLISRLVSTYSAPTIQYRIPIPIRVKMNTGISLLSRGKSKDLTWGTEYHYHENSYHGQNALCKVLEN